MVKYNTREITCPYCGHEKHDSWEYPFDGESPDDIECGECGKTYRAWRNIEVTYSSEAKE